MKICLQYTAYTPGGYLTRSLESIIQYSKHEIIPFIFLHNSRYEELKKECEELHVKYGGLYFPYGVNRGLTVSTNDTIYYVYEQRLYDILVCASQDIYFTTPRAFDGWIEEAKPYLENKCWIGNLTCIDDQAPFGICIFTRKGFDIIGYNDENFFPAQYDDIDIHRRLSLALGLDVQNFKNAEYRKDILTESIHDSMLSRRKDTSLLIQQYYITTPLNQLYFVKKWGGVDGTEHYIYPFNDKSIGYKISLENRHHPYGPKHDRQDQGIVRI